MRDEIRDEMRELKLDEIIAVSGGLRNVGCETGSCVTVQSSGSGTGNTCDEGDS